jgi:hypothetical protein
MDTAFRTLGWGGRHLVLGFASGQIGTLRGNLTIVKGASLVGVDLRQFREKQPEDARRLMQDVAALHRDGRIAPRIAARLPLHRHAEAYALAQDRGTLGRVLLLPSAESAAWTPFPTTTFLWSRACRWWATCRSSCATRWPTPARWKCTATWCARAPSSRR